MPVSDLIMTTPHKGYATFNTYSGGNAVLQLIHDTLVAAGWEAIEVLDGNTSLCWPFGVPTQTSGVSIVDRAICTIYANGYSAVTLYWFNPAVPGDSAYGSVALANAALGSLQNMATAVGTIRPALFNITQVNPSAPICNRIEGRNNDAFVGNGAVSIGGTIAGAGWRFRSQSQQTINVGGVVKNGTRMEILVRTASQTSDVSAAYDDTLLIQVSDLGSPETFINYYLAKANWTLIADDCQALFWATDAASNIYSGNTHLWVCAPFIPTDQSAPAEAWFLAQGSGLHQTIGVSGATYNARMWINGAGGTADDIAQQGWSIGAFYYPHTPGLTDYLEVPALTQAFVMMRSTAGESRFCGLIPNAFVESIQRDTLYPAAIDGVHYRAVASQSAGSIGTLWMATAETGAITP